MDWAAEARPQTAEEARRSPSHPDVVHAAKQRGITSIVHFTRFPGGLVGILDSSAVKARYSLPLDARLKYVYKENAPDRSRDRAWLRYVNLSVTSINMHMFDYSKRTHPNADWVILEFAPDILGDPGVVFCTTNNIYPAVRRRAGIRGFEQMFDQNVAGKYGYVHDRRNRTPHQTTDLQAEVLYPFELALDHLHTITVSDGDTEDSVVGILGNLPHHARIRQAPEAFQ